MIAVVDYCKGNLKSVERGLQGVGADARITDDPRTIRKADAIVLPGVGSFADAARTMAETGQMDAIREAIAQGKPFLGICLGEHLLFAGGTEHAGSEGAVPGLGLIEGIADKMPATDAQGNSYKIPHVGWNSIEFVDAACPLFEGIPDGEYFYFTHSYCAPKSTATVATTTHSVTFPSVVQVGDRVFGVQFHPEKSSTAGAQVLANFVALAKSKTAR
ncbi:imidazole glycerol phosphate synthase subunit HisH [Anaerotardibacter muris]|uniref:imidazole glycerol phosphate synthase subunit HisH n=1 Tax=Anaerotardibacter muris TaxID=2941505 RepID=UPI00203E84F3|nr:imidazole glycerol phosphate synthase subunit HisH [Anaerotardibacter muris]